MTEYKFRDRTVEYPVYRHYANDWSTVVRQLTDDQETILQIRRIDQPKTVRRNEMHELQIEITINKIGMKRNQSMHSSFIVPVNVADAIGNACLKTQEELKQDQKARDDRAKEVLNRMSPAGTFISEDIANALSTEEKGQALVEVARNAHEAEQREASFLNMVRNGDYSVETAYQKVYGDWKE